MGLSVRVVGREYLNSDQVQVVTLPLICRMCGLGHGRSFCETRYILPIL